MTWLAKERGSQTLDNHTNLVSIVLIKIIHNTARIKWWKRDSGSDGPARGNAIEREEGQGSDGKAK